MAKVIAYETADGLSVIIPAIPTGAKTIVVEDAVFPVDRTFRRAWKIEGDGIAVDMPIAREVWRNIMRAQRTLLMPALDVQFQRLQESQPAALAEDASAEDRAASDVAMNEWSARVAAVVAAKQALRDVTTDPAIDQATTPDELKAVWPGILL